MSKKNESPAPVAVEAVVKTEKRGRPVDLTSPRQLRLAAQAAKVAAGGSVKRGRPAIDKPAVVKALKEPTVKAVKVKKAKPAPTNLDIVVDLEDQSPVIEENIEFNDEPIVLEEILEDDMN